MCVCAGLEDNPNFYDHFIDKSYALLTEVNGKPCKKAITSEDLETFFQDLAIELWPYDDEYVSYGHILQFYIFPHLLWNLIPLRS